MAQQKKDGIVHVRVSADDKEAAEAIYADMGISLSEAVRMFIHESIKLNTLPFRPVSGLTKGKMQAAGPCTSTPTKRCAKPNTRLESSR